MLLFRVKEVFLPMEEVWSMPNTDTQCTVEGREEAKGQRNFFMFKFFLSCHKIWTLFHRTFPDLVLFISPFGWFRFVSFCYNNTLIINIVVFWVLWIALVNYQTWGGSGNPQICRHLVRSEGGLETSALTAGIWNEGSLVKDCALHLSSLVQLQVVDVRSHCNAPCPLINSG